MPNTALQFKPSREQQAQVLAVQTLQSLQRVFGEMQQAQQKFAQVFAIIPNNPIIRAAFGDAFDDAKKLFDSLTIAVSVIEDKTPAPQEKTDAPS